jgi:hypothetical protein
MTRAEHVLKVCTDLSAMPTWSVASLFQKYAWHLERSSVQLRGVKVYRGQVADPTFDEVTLAQPVYGGKGGWGLGLRLQKDASVSLKQLTPALPKKFLARTNPPALGAKGPPVTRSSHTWQIAGGQLLMQLERVDGAPDEIVRSIHFKRDQPLDPPSYDQLDQYRAVECNDEHGHSYLIEESTSLEEKVRVEAISLRERMLKLSYTCIDPLVGDLLARRLIRHALLGQLMLHELEGKVDRIEYTDLESKHSVIKRWMLSAEKP